MVRKAKIGEKTSDDNSRHLIGKTTRLPPEDRHPYDGFQEYDEYNQSLGYRLPRKKSNWQFPVLVMAIAAAVLCLVGLTWQTGVSIVGTL